MIIKAKVEKIFKLKKEDRYGYVIEISQNGEPIQIVTYRVYWESYFKRNNIKCSTTEKNKVSKAIEENLLNLLKAYKCSDYKELKGKTIEINCSTFDDKKVYSLPKNPKF